MDYTILMPCLNEEKTVGLCVKNAKEYLITHELVGEVLVVDNGSTDQSVFKAKKNGGRVVYCKDPGYGCALRYGFRKALGDFIIFADCDLSYDFSMLDEFIKGYQEGYDMVIGNRLLKSMEKGAMSFSHRYIGVPFLSFLGRKAYKTDIIDFHCGLRGIRKDRVMELSLHTTGMEFASEMIGAALRSQLKIKQIPILYHKDLREGPSHLRTIQDGFRHLHFLMKDGFFHLEGKE